MINFRKYTLIMATAACSFYASAQQQQPVKKHHDKNRASNNAINTDNATPVKLNEYVIGDWTLERVSGGKQNVSNTKTANDQQVLSFTREARYILMSGNQKIDSGAFRTNEQQGTIYLESEVDEKPTEWKVSFNDDVMIMKMRNKPAKAQDLTYTYRKDLNSARNQGN